MGLGRVVWGDPMAIGVEPTPLPGALQHHSPRPGTEIAASSDCRGDGLPGTPSASSWGLTSFALLGPGGLSRIMDATKPDLQSCEATALI